MSFASIMSLLGSLGPVLEPILMNLEQGTVQPELKALIDKVSSPDLKLLLQALDAAFDAFAQAEIKKMAP